MARAVLLSFLVLGLCGCQSDRSVEVLDNESFLAHFSVEAGATNETVNVTTNETVNITTNATGQIITNIVSEVSTNAAGGASTNATGQATGKARVIVPGAQVTIVVDQDHSLDRQVVVPGTGIIDFPPLGSVPVAGLTTDALAKALKAALEKDYLQAATVVVTAEGGAAAAATPGSRGVIYVMGQVGRPGPIALPKADKFTVFQAIIAAGGFTTFAKGTAVQLVRYDENGTKCVTRVNVQHILVTGEYKDDIPLQDGDWLIVPEKIINF